MSEPRNRLWGDDWKDVRSRWPLDSSVAQLNHGSFGATPTPVLEAQRAWSDRIEREPVQFFQRDLPVVIDEARAKCAAFLNADVDGFVFVQNATVAINSVAKSLAIERGDEILVSNHVYPAVYFTMLQLCESRGGHLVVQDVPLPTSRDGEELADAFLAGLSDRTRLVVIDHIASPTGVIFPVKRIVDACRKRGVLCMVDAAHAPGMLPVDLHALDPDLWTGNFHKWVCAPKVSAGFYVRENWRDLIHPAITSNYTGQGFDREFLWVGTTDPTAYLATPDAIDFFDALGWDRVRQHNHELATYGRRVVSDAVGTELPFPDSPNLFGSMALVALPPHLDPGDTEKDVESYRDSFRHRTGIEATFIKWNDRPFIRLSAQVYNAPSEYDRLAEALVAMSAHAHP